MSLVALTAFAPQVLAHFPAPLQQGACVPLSNHGGFSGARLWRIGDALCLRASPLLVEAEQLTQLHRWMMVARNEGLAFVPSVFTTLDQRTCLTVAGRQWELMTWMEGQASYRTQPTPWKLQAACRALAQLHLSWERFAEAAPREIPGVERRLMAAERGLQEPIDGSLDRVQQLLRYRLPQVAQRLAPWRRTQARLQPCLCDVWHDHLLFTGERLTGLVDYAAMKFEHPAVDLARLLGSLVEDDDEGWRSGLAAYRGVRAFSEEDEALARVLDVTGTIIGAANWVRWLSTPRESEERARAMKRLGTLLQRMDRWK